MRDINPISFLILGILLGAMISAFLFSATGASHWKIIEHNAAYYPVTGAFTWRTDIQPLTEVPK